MRISTWNVLASAYASPQRYAYAGDARALSWGSRLRQISSALARERADVLLLQEVDHPGDLARALQGQG